MGLKPTRSFLGVLYPDSESYSCDAALLALSKYFDEYAYILHDMDADENGEQKKSHYHWVGRCKNARLLSAVASALGVPENAVEVCRGWRASVKYLIHADNPEKYQYDAELICGNIDILQYLSSLSSSQMAGQIFEEITSHFNTVTSLTQYAITNGLWSEYRRGFSIWMAVLQEQNYMEERTRKNENDNH